MASDENHAPLAAPDSVFNNDDDIIDEEEDDTEEEEEEEDEEEDQEDEEEEEDDDDDDEKEQPLEQQQRQDLNSSVTVAVPPPAAQQPPLIPIVDASSTLLLPATTTALPAQPAEERKLFQRLWTDEDEIELLQGFLDYSTQRGTSQNNPHDTALFYDQIKSKLQLDFNKNQLVEKLRRLKKKYRNVLARMSSGKEVAFKSPHDQATFEIASKIWGGGTGSSSQQGSKDHHHQMSQNQSQHQSQNHQIQIDDDMPPPLTHSSHHHTSNFNHGSAAANLNLNFGGSFNGSGGVGIGGGGGGGGYGNHHHYGQHGERGSGGGGGMEERKGPVVGQRSKKRSRVKMEDIYNNSSALNSSAGQGSGSGSVPFRAPGGMVEEAAAAARRPLFREMLGNVERFGGGSRVAGGFGGEGIVSPVPLSFASPTNLFGGVENADERWRKQQIMELEVYSKRLELVQEHIKLTLEQLRSAGSCD